MSLYEVTELVHVDQPFPRLPARSFESAEAVQTDYNLTADDLAAGMRGGLINGKILIDKSYSFLKN